MVFQYEVYHPWAVGLEVKVFVVQQRVYLASSLLRFVGVVVGALLDEDVRCPVLRATSLCARTWAALGSAVTVGGSGGSATWGTMPVSVGKFQYILNIPGWWALWVSRRVRESASFFWVTASGCIVVG